LFETSARSRLSIFSNARLPLIDDCEGVATGVGRASAREETAAGAAGAGIEPSDELGVKPTGGTAAGFVFGEAAVAGAMRAPIFPLCVIDTSNVPSAQVYWNRTLPCASIETIHSQPSARSHGGGSLERALKKALAKFLLISFTSDWLYPPGDAQEIDAALRANGQPSEYHNIDVPYGHDSFLLETDVQTPLIGGFLERVYNGE